MASSSGPTPPLVVLLVEDNVGEAKLVKLALGRSVGQAFDVCHVRRLEEAIVALRERSFDAVLLDLSLPDSDGLDTLARILSLADLPVLVLTGFDDRERDFEAMNMGAQDYLLKGDSYAFLPRAVRYSIGRHQAMRRQWSAEEELRDAHRETRHLLESMPLLLIGLDESRFVRWWSEDAERILGVPTSVAIGQSFDVLEEMWESRSLRDQVSQVVSDGPAVTLEDYTIRAESGEDRVVEIAVSRINPCASTSAGVLIVGSDVTDRRRLEQRLVQAQKLESIGQLAAGIAHEINTPTQYVGDNVRFLRDAFQDLVEIIQRNVTLVSGSDIEYLVEEVPKAIDQSLEGLENVASIVKAMRTFSHPGTSEKTLVDLRESLSSAAVVARNEWKYTSKITTDFDSSLRPVACFPRELNQALLNLIINAAHANEEAVNAGRLQQGVIYLSASDVGQCAQIKVRDTGTGIAEEIASRVFDPFFTTKEVGRGTGQGLCLVHAVIVEMHQGSIGFESTEEGGTEFTIELPFEGSKSAAREGRTGLTRAAASG